MSRSFILSFERDKDNLFNMGEESAIQCYHVHACYPVLTSMLSFANLYCPISCSIVIDLMISIDISPSDTVIMKLIKGRICTIFLHCSYFLLTLTAAALSNNTQNNRICCLFE